MPRKKKTHEKDAAEHYEPAREGDVIGLSDADPAVDLPHPVRADDRKPKGIEPLAPMGTGVGDTPQRAGSTGADLGGYEDGEADRD